jgi:hypothetical protein
MEASGTGLIALQMREHKDERIRKEREDSRRSRRRSILHCVLRDDMDCVRLRCYNYGDVMTPFEAAQVRAIIFKERWRLTTDLSEIANQLKETEVAMSLVSDEETLEMATNDMEELHKILVDILSKSEGQSVGWPVYQ